MKKFIILLVVFLLCGFAQAILVTNYSFEDPNAGKQKRWDGEDGYTNVPGWTDGTAVASDSGVEQHSYITPTDGTWAGFMKSNDSPVWNLTDYDIVSGESYQLIVDSIATSGSGGANLQLQMRLFYDNSGTRVPLDTKIVTVPDRVDPYPWGTFTLTLPSGDVASGAIGNKIGIELDNVSGSGTWIGMDNVRLNVIPEPITLVLLGLGSLPILRRRRI